MPLSLRERGWDEGAAAFCLPSRVLGRTQLLFPGLITFAFQKCGNTLKCINNKVSLLHDKIQSAFLCSACSGRTDVLITTQQFIECRQHFLE